MDSFKKIVGQIAIFGICLMAVPHSLQSQASSEELILILEEITSQEDTLLIQQALDWIGSSKDSTLLLYDPGVVSEMSRLEVVLDDSVYYSLVLYLFYRELDIDTDTAKYAAIQYAKEFIAAHDQSSSLIENQTLLWILTDARRPFRNSDRIYDGIRYYNGLIAPALANKDSLRLTLCYYVLGGFYSRLSLDDKTEYAYLKSVQYLDNRQPTSGQWDGLAAKMNRYSILGSLNTDLGKYEKGKQYLDQALKYAHKIDSGSSVYAMDYVYFSLAVVNSYLNPDSSEFYLEEAFIKLKNNASSNYTSAFLAQEKAIHFIARGLLDSALVAIDHTRLAKDSLGISTVSSWGELLPDYYRAKVYLLQNNPTPIPDLLANEISNLTKTNARFALQKELELLVKAYDQIENFEEKSKTLERLIDIRKTIKNEADSARAISYEVEQQMEAASLKIAIAEAQAESNERANFYLIGVAALLTFSAITLIIAFLNKRKSNKQLAGNNEELNRTLEQLRSTQTQLIHSEKMASLGELTAGIAHEIQNPLNFVNNFSDLNKELVAELKEAIKAKDNEEIQFILPDLLENETKINFHGKRAAEIVRSMLQHSRAGSGEKELTAINALADEYLRLAYHGLRAKDKSFNADFKTDLDPNLPKVKVISQDIGRVILNLINNAFQAVKGVEKPEVVVSTQLISAVDGGHQGVIIAVSDNGPGIPDNIKEKIFQPFFTTKAAGSGTGLGLSLSYDIITKGHGGTIVVESGEGEGTKFIIELPIR